MNKQHVSILFSLLITLGLNAQQPLNLDFEKQSVEGVKRPWGWSSQTWGVDFTMNSTTVKTRKYSLYSKCLNKKSTCNNQSIAFNIEAYDLLEKNITLMGNLKGKIT